MSEHQRGSVSDADPIDAEITKTLAGMVDVPDMGPVHHAVQRRARRRRVRSRALNAIAVVLVLAASGTLLSRVGRAEPVPVAGPVPSSQVPGRTPSPEPRNVPLALGEWVNGTRTPVVLLNWQWHESTVDATTVDATVAPTLRRLAARGYPTDPDTIRIGNLTPCLGPNHEYLDDPRGELVIGVALAFTTIADAEEFALDWGAGADFDLLWVRCADPDGDPPGDEVAAGDRRERPDSERSLVAGPKDSADAAGVDPNWPPALEAIERGKNAIAYIDAVAVADEPGIDRSTPQGRAEYEAFVDAKVAEYEESYYPQMQRLEKLGYDTAYDSGGPNVIAVDSIGQPVPFGVGVSCAESSLRQLGYARDDVVVGLGVPFDSLAEAETFANSWGNGAQVAYPWVECLG